MSKSMFVNEFAAQLQGKIGDNDLNKVLMELSIFLSDWEVDKQSTAIVPYDGLPECYKVYMVAKKIEGRSLGTLNLYKICLEDMFARIGKSVDKISTNDLRVYLYMLQKERNISNRTLDSRRLILNGFFGWCADEGYIIKNPCASISPIKYTVKPREAFSDEEMELIRIGCNDLRDKALVEVLYATGCRCQELAILKREDIDLEKREVYLFGKGKKYRTAYLNARAVVALKLYFKSRVDDDPHVFVSVRKPFHGLSNAGIEKVMRSIGNRAGVDKVYPHRMRHTFATDALNHGMPVTDLQSILGHEKLDTTMIYSKVQSESVRSNYRRCIA